MIYFTYITGAFTVLGFGFAIFEYFQRKRLEQFTKSTLHGIAGNLAKIHQSTGWADNHFRQIQREAVELAESEGKKKIIIGVSDGQGDSTSADRMVINLFNELLSYQEAQFGTREITHPERTLELIQKEETNHANRMNRKSI